MFTNKRIMKSLLTMLLLAMAGTYLSAEPLKVISDELEGTWSFTVETPDMVYKGKLVFAKNGDGYTGKMIIGNGEVSLKNLKVTDNKFSFSTEADGYYVDVKGKVEGDELSAEVAVEGTYLAMDGKRE
jgi:hypothetical protein